MSSAVNNTAKSLTDDKYLLTYKHKTLNCMCDKYRVSETFVIFWTRNNYHIYGSIITHTQNTVNSIYNIYSTYRQYQLCLQYVQYQLCLQYAQYQLCLQYSTSSI